MKTIDQFVEKISAAVRRRDRRASPSGLGFAFADSVQFLPATDWQQLTHNASFFMTRGYRLLLEKHSPAGMQHRYALIYRGAQPVVALAAQVLEIRGDQLANLTDSKVRNRALKAIKERMMVCGSLVSSGFHGLAFAEDIEPDLAWAGVAEALYRIRRADRLNGQIDYVMIKDLDATQSAGAVALKDFSFRALKTAPEMALKLSPKWKTFDHYLADLNARYRSKVRKVIKAVETAGYRVEHGVDAAVHDARLHALYCEVEGRAATRLSTLPAGYFAALAKHGGAAHFRCSLIRNDETIVGFITTVKDGERALGYYVGFDYAVNETVPLYLRLLQCLIVDAIDLKARELSFGRTAMEPKAALGATAHASDVWLRHRVSAANVLLREVFTRVSPDAAPQRQPFKDEP